MLEARLGASSPILVLCHYQITYGGHKLMNNNCWPITENMLYLDQLLFVLLLSAKEAGL